MQTTNIQFAFTNNIPKPFVESFYQIGLLVLYEFLYRSLEANTIAIMEEILEKT